VDREGTTLAPPSLAAMTANVNAMLDVVIEQSVARASRHLGPARVSSLSAGENERGLGPPAGASALPGLRSRLIRLRGSAQRLVSAEPGSAFAEPQVPQVVSSRRRAVEAEGVAGSSRGRPAMFHVQVRALARSQVNEGTALDASALAGIHPGINTFTIASAGGNTRTITFDGNAAETNAEELARLADAINAAGAGVVASVVAEDEAGTVRLDLAAIETGTPHAFTVADIAGNAVAATGIAPVSATAADARLVIDGVARTSASNTLLIDGGRVRLVLRAVTGPGQSDDEIGALISVAPDPISRATTGLVDALNDLREFIEGSPAALMLKLPDMPNLGRAIDVMLASRAQELEALGLAIGARISVDVDRLAREIEGSRDRVEVVLGAGEGLATKLSVLAEEGLGGWFARALHHMGRGAGAILARHALISPASRDRGLLIDVVG
jgi:flagellar hook-associated protein 2